MFKKSPKTKQFNLFSSPSGLMCEREGRMYDDESAWHNKFYKEVTSKVDEDIFKPLYTTEREDNRVGRPNASIRILVSMMILKEGCGCSDEQLYEQCRFNLLYRRALGMVTLDEQCPAIDSYYGFRRKICEYEEQKGVNLFDKCFKQITKAQAIEYRISGKAIRMDSKLISSNIAWYSRYEIIHATFVKCVSEESLSRIDDQLVHQVMDRKEHDESRCEFLKKALRGSFLVSAGLFWGSKEICERSAFKVLLFVLLYALCGTFTQISPR